MPEKSCTQSGGSFHSHHSGSLAATTTQRRFSRTPNAPFASTTYLIGSHPSLTAAILKGAKTVSLYSSGV